MSAEPAAAKCPDCGGLGYYATGPTDAPVQTQCRCWTPEPAAATTCTLCDYGIELRESGLHSVTPNVFILCAKVLKRAPEPAPALSDEVREAVEMLRLTLSMRDAKRACDDRACSNVALGALNLLAALASRGGRK